MPSTTKKATGLRPATFDHLRKKAPLERTISVPLSDDAVTAYTEAVDALERAKLTGAPVDGLEIEAAAAKALLDAETVELRFRSIGRKAYDALLREHPATDKIKDEAKANGDPEPPYNPDTFAPALVAASCVEPEMSLEQVNELFDAWNTAEVLELWSVALEVNTQRRVVDLGKAYG